MEELRRVKDQKSPIQPQRYRRMAHQWILLQMQKLSKQLTKKSHSQIDLKIQLMLCKLRMLSRPLYKNSMKLMLKCLASLKTK